MATFHKTIILISLLFLSTACGGDSETQEPINDDTYVYYDESYLQCNWGYFKELTGATVYPWWYDADNIKAIFFVHTDYMTVGEVEAMRLSIADAPIYISTVNNLNSTLYQPSVYQGLGIAIEKIKVEAEKNNMWEIVLDRKRDHHKWLTVDSETNTNGYYSVGCDVVMETIAELIYGSVISFN